MFRPHALTCPPRVPRPTPGEIDFEEFSTLFAGMSNEDLTITSLARRWLHSSDVSSPQALFDSVWRKVQSRHADSRGAVNMPAELLFLSGAPGSGKGTNTKLIMKERGMNTSPVVVSSLLNSCVAGCHQPCDCAVTPCPVQPVCAAHQGRRWSRRGLGGGRSSV